MKKLILLLCLLLAQPCYAMNIKSNTAAWLPVILTNGSATGKAETEIAWDNAALIVSYETTGITGTRMSKKTMTNTSWLNLGRGLYLVSFEAADVGTPIGEFYYFVSVDQVTLPYWGVRQVLTTSHDTAQTNIGSILSDTGTDGVYIDWAHVQNPTSTVDLSATTIFSTDSAFKVYSIDNAVRVARVFDVNSVDTVHKIASIDSAVNINKVFNVVSVDTAHKVYSIDSAVKIDRVFHVNTADSVALLISADRQVIAGIDWGHIAFSGATVDLSATTIYSSDNVYRIESADSNVRIKSVDGVSTVLTPILTDTSSITTQITTMSADTMKAIKTYR